MGTYTTLEDPVASRERIAERMGTVALSLAQCVAARDAVGVERLLHGRARSTPAKHAVAVILADLLNAALGFPATPESVAVVRELAQARTEGDADAA
jgi:hypothetical protein